MKVLVTGCLGQVGYRLVKQLKIRPDIELLAYDRNMLDITRQDEVFIKIKNLQPDVIINAAAYTAVDKAETDTALSYAINRDGAKYLAQAAEHIDALLLHISTDYVFDGIKPEPYREDDETEPKSIYGLSKLAGEQAIQKYCSRYVILRTSWVFCEHGNNFVKTMLGLGAKSPELRVVGDQYGGPTYAGDIASTIITMMDKYNQESNTPSGIFHYSGTPYVSWYQFADEVFELAVKYNILSKAPKVMEISSAGYPTPAPRPKNSRLSCEKIKEYFGIEPSNWKHALEKIQEYQQ